MNTLTRAAEVHSGKYDYSKFEYVNRHTKGVIICPVHGEFQQDMHSHLKGHGCGACSGVKRHTQESFVAAATAVHGARFDYTETVFSGWLKPVSVRCREHGAFVQEARNHVRTSHCCPQCEAQAASKARTKNPTLRLEALGLTVVRAGATRGKATLSCPKHGEFTAIAQDVLAGSRCPRCAIVSSRGEKELAGWVKSLLPGMVVLVNDRTVLAPKELDVLIPAMNLAIEYNGVWYHSDAFPGARTKHSAKTAAALEKGVRLIHVFEDEWKLRQSATKNALRCILGSGNKQYARKGTVVFEKAKDVAEFLDEFHIQGRVRSGEAVSLFIDGARVATMVFSNVTNQRGVEGACELVRFASAGQVVGAASRLFRHYVRAFNPKGIVSFSDNRWFTGGMYQMLGFLNAGVTRPDYRWVDGKSSRRMHKSNFRKAKLREFPGYEPHKSEAEICHGAGMARVYDCGLTRWVWGALVAENRQVC